MVLGQVTSYRTENWGTSSIFRLLKIQKNVVKVNANCLKLGFVVLQLEYLRYEVLQFRGKKNICDKMHC